MTKMTYWATLEKDGLQFDGAGQLTAFRACIRCRPDGKPDGGETYIKNGHMFTSDHGFSLTGSMNDDEAAAVRAAIRRTADAEGWPWADSY